MQKLRILGKNDIFWYKEKLLCVLHAEVALCGLPIDEMHIRINPSKMKVLQAFFFFPIGSTRAGWDLVVLPRDSWVFPPESPWRFSPVSRALLLLLCMFGGLCLKPTWNLQESITLGRDRVAQTVLLTRRYVFPFPKSPWGKAGALHAWEKGNSCAMGFCLCC